MNQRKARIMYILAIATVVAFAIFAKLFYVQVLASEKYSGDSLNNRLQNVEITPNRGVIYDRNNEVMAISVEKMSVYITPSVIRESSSRDEIVKDISKCLHMTKTEINKVIDGSSNDFAWLKRQCEKEDAKKLQEMNYIGIGFTTEYAREYPNNEELCHVLGFSGLDNQGLAGIELQYDKVLAGTPGKLVVEYDKLGNAIPQSIRESVPAKEGENVYLTIDSTVQFYMEQALAKAQEEQQAEAMTSILMDVETGEILAMANIPDFNPNNYGEYEPETWSNLAVSKLYEPGSPFKSLSTSMYLEDDIIETDTQLTCGGYIMIDDHRFQDWDYPEGDGLQTMKHALEQSCNVAQAQCVEKLGLSRFYNYLDGFGMTVKTGVDLPAEASPILIDEEDAVPLDLAASAIGQGNAYTAMQMITAFCSVVNGGKLMKPQIVSKIVDPDGNVTSQMEPEVVRQVISEDTSAQMRDMLEGVVEEGLGTPAAVPGYRVGGKTGTAEIASDGSYQKGNYILSFVGFAPVENPKYACIVIVDSPASGGNSGTLAGGIFSEIMENTLNYYEVPQTETISTDDENVTEAEEVETVTVPDIEKAANAEEARALMVEAGLNVDFVSSGSEVVCCLPRAGTKVAKGSTVEFYCINDTDSYITLPSFEGKTIKEVDAILTGYGLKSKFSGSGLAYRQEAAAGTSVAKGDTVSVWFAGSEELAKIEEETKKIEETALAEQQAALEASSNTNTNQATDSGVATTTDQTAAATN